jgi:hypothetical protein
MTRADTSLERPDDLTAEWLTANIGAGRVSGFTVERIGTGQMSECYRVALTYDEDEGPSSRRPRSVVLKVAASDPMSRGTGQALGLYEREVRFYADVAPRLSADDGPIAHCYHASYQPDTGIFTLLIDDAAPAVVGDEISGASIEDAKLALRQLGRLHAPLIGRGTLADAAWLNRESPMNQALITGLFNGFTDRYGESITPQQRLVCQKLVDSFDAHLAQEAGDDRIKGLVHGDYRLDNMLFGRPGSLRDLTVVDWQTVTWGPAFTDLAYFLGCALRTEDRRAHYGELLDAYYQGLGPNPRVAPDEVREGVRRQSFFGVMMAIVSSMLVERTERGDRMFLTMLDRHSSHVLDTGALDVLPAAAATPALQPDPDDEAAHTPGDESLWNESWYWDFADPEQGIGGWIRLGLMPNQNLAWINALICGPDIPTIACLDFHAPMPENPNDLRSGEIEMRHAATVPLREYRVSVDGPAQAYDDPSDLLRGEEGRPCDLGLDLMFSTSGTPYAYRIATRYEIPCAVSGNVTVDGRTYTLTAVPGQRDHSHGVRDWWSMDWVWSALHLDDGTHLHGVDLRIPGMPPVSVGYIQPPDGPVIETASVTAEADVATDGLPLSTTLTMHPGPLPAGRSEATRETMVATINIRGHAPVRLVSPDGRVSFFPRAWAAIETADGRTGVGWLEWNTNQQSD